MSFNELSPDVRSAIEQLLETDRLLGMKFVPLPTELLATAPDTRTATASTDPREHASRGTSASTRATAPAPQPTRQSGPGTATPDRSSPATRNASTATGVSNVPAPARRAGGSAAPVGDSDRDQRLQVIDEQVRGCTKCELHRGRTQTVFGQGSATARLVFVGEAPGFEEDRQGLAFVGKAGQLLTKMIEAMGLTRDEVYICNTVKCRPPNNRTPTADEILACNPYLSQQLEIIQPEMIVALGAPAAKTLLNTAETIGRLRGRFHEYYYSGIAGSGPSVPVMPTFHPAYLLRSPEEKRKAWEDLQLVMQRLGLRRPAGG